MREENVVSVSMGGGSNRYRGVFIFFHFSCRVVEVPIYAYLLVYSAMLKSWTIWINGNECDAMREGTEARRGTIRILRYSDEGRL